MWVTSGRTQQTPKRSALSPLPPETLSSVLLDGRGPCQPLSVGTGSVCASLLHDRGSLPSPGPGKLGAAFCPRHRWQRSAGALTFVQGAQLSREAPRSGHTSRGPALVRGGPVRRSHLPRAGSGQRRPHAAITPPAGPARVRGGPVRRSDLPRASSGQRRSRAAVRPPRGPAQVRGGPVRWSDLQGGRLVERGGNRSLGLSREGTAG